MNPFATPRNFASAALLAVAAGVALFVWLMPQRPAVGTVAAADPAGVAPVGRAPVRVAALAVAAPRAAAASDPVSGRCGLDQVPAPAERGADGNDDAAPLPAGKRAGPGYLAAVQRIDARLRASADPFARAAAVWIDAGNAESPTERMDQLAQLGASTNDARVYALAFRACVSDLAGADRAACGLLSARQWARVDDGDAMPWLYVLQEATDAGDVPGEEEALFHMAASSRFDNRTFAAPAEIGAVAADDAEALAAGEMLAIRAFAMSAAQMPPLSALTGACRDKAHGDANRAQFCAAAATLLLEHSDDMLMQSVGGALDFLSTGDPARRDRLRSERAAIPARGFEGEGQSDCAKLRNVLRHFQRAAAVGELAAARESNSGIAAP